MKEEDYYPAGAYLDPNAPYNQPDDPDCYFCGNETTYESRNEVAGFRFDKKLHDEVDCIYYKCDDCLRKECYFEDEE